MEMEFHVLLPATATASLFPASEPYSGDVHFLHTWMDKMKSPQGKDHSVGKEECKRADVFRWQWFLKNQVPLCHMDQVMN